MKALLLVVVLVAFGLMAAPAQACRVVCMGGICFCVPGR